MNALRRTKNLLAKAQRLAELLEASDEITNNERDLMLVYLRDVYDVFAEDTQYVLREALRTAEAIEQVDTAQKTTATPKKDWDGLITTATQFLENTKPALSPDPIDLPVELPIASIEPIVVINEIPEETPVVVLPEPPLVVLPDPPVSPPKTPKKLPIAHYDEEDENASVNADATAESLFETTQTADYGSAKPIHNLHLAFGINERIFNINELFGSSAGQYEQTLTVLDALPNFAEAKAYLLANTVAQFGWQTPAKRKKAQWFIGQVRRRYVE